MDYDDLRRAKVTNEVSAKIESFLTLSLAFKAAAKFSNEAAITEGEGLLGEDHTRNIQHLLLGAGGRVGRTVGGSISPDRDAADGRNDREVQLRDRNSEVFARKDVSSCSEIDRLQPW